MWKKIVFIALLAAVLPRLISFVVFMGYHSHVFNHRPGPCRQLPVIEHGAEDMQLLPNGKVLITSGLRDIQRTNPTFDGREGRIYLFEMFLPGMRPEPVRIEGKPDLEGFHPHGISAWVNPESGAVTVFIVNHQYLNESFSVVDKFSYDAVLNVLHHQETIGKGDPAFRVLNDVVAVSENEFYFTNTMHYVSKLEVFLMLRWGDVGFYDGQKAHSIAKGHYIPNGINISPDQKYVYVAHFGDKSLEMYARQPDNNLTLLETQPLYSSPDNINVDQETGDLILGMTPVGWKMMQHIENPALQSPSQVLRLKVKDGHVTDIRQIMADDGSFLSASSGAVYFRGRYLLGSVYSTPCICDDKS